MTLLLLEKKRGGRVGGESERGHKIVGRVVELLLLRELEVETNIVEAFREGEEDSGYIAGGAHTVHQPVVEVVLQLQHHQVPSTVFIVAVLHSFMSLILLVQ